MGTRSFIGLLNKDGSVRAIYHHWDGYLECVGYMLVMHYKTEDVITKLLDLGNMSIIGPEPVGIWGEGPAQYCQTYTARGETGQEARTYDSVEHYLSMCHEDYTYLFKEGQWFYRTWDDTELKSVKEDLGYTKPIITNVGLDMDDLKNDGITVTGTCTIYSKDAEEQPDDEYCDDLRFTYQISTGNITLDDLPKELHDSVGEILEMLSENIKTNCL